MTKNKLVETTKKELRELDDLTLKQRTFLKLYFETGNGTKSAFEAYNCKDMDSAASLSSEVLRTLKTPVRAFMESKGISLGFLCSVLAQGLQAKRTISAINTDKEATGVTTDFIEVPDHLVRHKYLETASRWLGIESKEGDNPNVKKRIVAEEFFE